MLGDSTAITLYDFFNIGLMQIDVLMLGLLVGRAPGVTLASVGVYAAASETASGLRRVGQVFSPIFTTLVARDIVARNPRRAEAMFGLTARWLLAVLFPAVAVFAMGGRAIMSVFGAEFAVADLWLAIVALGCASHAFVGLAEPILTIERPALNLINALVASVATFGANLVFISRLGPLGAALGTLVTSATYGILRSVEITWILGWRWPWQSLKRPAAAAALALPLALVVRVQGSSLALQCVSAGTYLLGYAAAWFWLGIDEADRQVLQHVLKHRPLEPSA